MAAGETVAVVGAGITGLAAAFELQRSGVDVAVLEAGNRAGGKIDASCVGGMPVDSGPDGFIARDTAAAELCRRLGLGADLVTPDASGASVWAGGRLRALPPGVLGAPFDADEAARTGIISEAGSEALRRGLAWDAPPLAGDASAGEVLRPRIGDEAFVRLVDPLLGGINAGCGDRMSIQACAAPLHEAAARGGPFGAALRQVSGRGAAGAPPAAAPGPVFQSVRGGAHRIVDALLRALGESVHLDARVTALRRGPRRAGRQGWILSTPQGEVAADGVIVAAPAFETARLIGPLAPEAAGTLAAVTYSDVALATFVVPAEGVLHPLDGSGFLVPRSEGLLMTACSWSSSKWSHYRRPGLAVLRVSAGRSDDTRWLQLEPRDLAVALAEELALAGIVSDLSTVALRPTGTTPVTEQDAWSEPDAWPETTFAARLGARAGTRSGAAAASGGTVCVRITPWRRSLPQYLPGHLDRVAEVDSQLAEAAPGVIATGAAFRGLGLPACVRQARSAAAALTGLTLC